MSPSYSYRVRIYDQSIGNYQKCVMPESRGRQVSSVHSYYAKILNPLTNEEANVLLHGPIEFNLAKRLGLRYTEIWSPEFDISKTQLKPLYL
jgi:hypothetical protein